MRVIEKINSNFDKFTTFVNNVDANNIDKGDVLYAGRNKIVKLTVAGENITVKSFRKPSFINRIIYTYFRKSKARRSYENSVRLQAAGIGTAAPIAFKEVYRGGLLAESCYICGYLADCEDLRWWTRKPNCDEVLEHAAEFIGTLHKKGVWHKDFSPGNIMYDKDWNFYLIDVNRMEFDVHDAKKLMDNFKCLHDEPEETQRLAEKYYKYTPFRAMADDDIVDMALAARNNYKSHQARKKALKKLIKFNK